MRRRSGRCFIRFVATFVSLSLTCTLVAFYGSVRLINDQTENQNTEPRFPLSWREKNENTRNENANFAQELLRERLNRRESKFHKLHEKGRALQGYAEGIIKHDSNVYVGFNSQLNSQPDTLSTEASHRSTYNKQPRILSCKEIRSIQIKEELGHGYTKIVQRGLLNGVEVAVKSVQESGKDVQRCLMENRKSKGECFNLIKYKLAKETLMLQQLKHSNVIKLLGFCWQNEVNSADIKERGLTMVTELGQPLDVLSMLQLPWQERLRVCLGLARLIVYMEHSPLGPLIIRDFRHPQFVLVSGEIKLTDLDDVDNEQRACASDRQCIVGTVLGNRTLSCEGGFCAGWNPAINMLSICRFFLDHILISEAPRKLRSEVHDIMIKAQTLVLSGEALVARLESVVKRLQHGEHVDIDPDFIGEYKALPKSDFPAMHDYSCDYSRQVGACERAAGSLAEAKSQCTRDPQCKAFVVTNAKTWIGHTIIYLKDHTADVRHSKDTTVYVRVTR